MNVASSVAAALADRAATAPGAGALAIDDRRWTAAELTDDVAAAAGWLDPRLAASPSHVNGQPRVAVCVADPADQLRWALAADWIGAAAAVLDVRWPPVVLAAALEEVQPDLVVRHGPDRADRPHTGAPAAVQEHHIGWISLTSGTSGPPRALGRTRQSWIASFPAFSHLTGLSAADTVLVPGPLSSSMFAFAAFHTLAVGARVRLLPGWRPALAAGAQITVAQLVPTMLADLLDQAGQSDLRPRVVVTAGAKLQPDLERRVRAAWPQTHVVEYYGSSEQSFVTARVGGDPGTVGRPFPGVQVEIRDDNGHRLPTGESGVIWTRSPYAAVGYLDETPGRFRQVGGWVSVGDRGRLDGAGVLTLLGRDRIATGGASVDPAAVEAVLRVAPSVRDVVVLGLPHPRLGEVVAAVVECRTDCRLSSLRRYARDNLAEAQRPRRWYAVEHLPRTGSGKPARAELLAAVQEGRLLPLS